jgi:hypothetical protein
MFWESGVARTKHEQGAFKAAKGTAGVVSGALLLSGVGAPIAVGIAAIAGIIALSEAGLTLSRNSAATGLIQIARRLDEGGRPIGKPEDAPPYGVMKLRVNAAYYRSIEAVIKSTVPGGFDASQFAAIKQFVWDDKKDRLESEDKQVVDGFAALGGLAEFTKRNKWLEVHDGERVYKEKPKGVAKAARALSPSAHKSRQAMEASKDDIVNALFDLGRGSFDINQGVFNTAVPLDVLGDTSLVENMEMITVGALLAAADITSQRWAAWVRTADECADPAAQETALRGLIRDQLS